MPRIHVAIPFTFTHPVDGQVDYAAGMHEVDDVTAEHSFTKAHLANAPPPPPVPGSTEFSVAENARKARAAAVQAMSDDELAEALKDRPFVRQEPVVPGKFAAHASLAAAPSAEVSNEVGRGAPSGEHNEPKGSDTTPQHHISTEHSVVHADEHDEPRDEDGDEDGEDGEEDEDEAAPTDATEQPKPKRRRRRRRA
jgi:hypothetical protein